MKFVALRRWRWMPLGFHMGWEWCPNRPGWYPQIATPGRWVEWSLFPRVA